MTPQPTERHKNITRRMLETAQQKYREFYCGGQIDPDVNYTRVVESTASVLAEHFPDWMPIETAPRDGRMMLLFGKDISENWVRGYWDDDIGCWDTDAGCFEDGPSLNEGIANGPTHWYPIPPVPILASPAEKGVTR